MNALNLPWFHMWPKDWLASMDILKMTAAEEGGYIRLLNMDWLNDGLPDDDQLLSEFSRLGSDWFNGGAQKIRPLFVPVRSRPTYITAIILQRMREEHIEFIEARRKGGKASGAKRKGDSEFGRRLVSMRRTNCQRTEERTGERTGNEPPSPSPDTDKHTPARGDFQSCEVIVPTLAEVIEWGKMDGVPEDVCKNFFTHHDGLGWMYRGTRITNPRGWLKGFAEKARRVPRAPGSRSSASALWEKKTRLDQLSKLMEEHPGHPKAAFDAPASSAQLYEFRKITEEMKLLQRQIALGPEPEKKP